MDHQFSLESFTKDLQINSAEDKILLYDHINEFGSEAATSKITKHIAAFHADAHAELKEASSRYNNSELTAMVDIQQPKPLSDQLGEYRILRTSPLTEVPFVCCTDC